MLAKTLLSDTGVECLKCIHKLWIHYRNIGIIVLSFSELCGFTFPIRSRKHGEDRRQAGGQRLLFHQRQVRVATDLHANNAFRRRGWNKTVRSISFLARLLSSVAGEIKRKPLLSSSSCCLIHSQSIITGLINTKTNRMTQFLYAFTWAPPGCCEEGWGGRLGHPPFWAPEQWPWLEGLPQSWMGHAAALGPGLWTLYETGRSTMLIHSRLNVYM